MSQKTIVSKLEYISYLKKEGGLYPSDLEEIDISWEKCALVASEVLPKIPSIGIISPKKRIACYYRVESLIDIAARRHGVENSKKDMVRFILQLSSKDYSKADDAILDDRVTKELYPQGKLRSNMPLTVLFMFVMCPIQEYKYDTFSDLYLFFTTTLDTTTTGIIVDPVDLQYRYRVNGLEYFAGREQIGFALGKEPMSKRYVRGQPVMIYFDNKAPKVAALNREQLVSGNLSMLAAILVLLLICLFV